MVLEMLIFYLIMIWGLEMVELFHDLQFWIGAIFSNGPEMIVYDHGGHFLYSPGWYLVLK